MGQGRAQKALGAGIKVLVKDIDIRNPKVISHSDPKIARQVLKEAL